MKKLLVLALVLGLSSMASATVSLSPAAAEVDPGGTVTISVMSDSDASYGGWLDLTQRADGSWGELQILPAAGQDASKSFAFDPWWEFAAVSFAPEFPVVAGAHFTVDFTAGQTEGPVQIDLYAADGVSLIGSTIVTVTPEPMTLGLLGLGGLFLRRRK